MYHALAVEDMLDLTNLAATFPEALPERWRPFVASWPETVNRMRSWLAAMCHPDGEISFFNDSTIGVAPSPAELVAYAERLGLQPLAALQDGVTHFADSGYIRVQWGDLVALLDVAPVGPDYLPGHAHADTLSFELSLFGQRVIVNSGTSRYGLGPERLRQRGTSAHNTVTIDGQDSSEVWGGFRVARRARPFDLQVDESAGEIRISCAHDGYRRLPGRPVHRREWRFCAAGLTLVDQIEGRFQNAVGRLYFSPERLLSGGQSCDNGVVKIFEGHEVAWIAEDAQARIVQATYHPGFGLEIPGRCLETRPNQSRWATHLNWK
jgi:uncharacterized heparinase superfamily protein